MTYPQALLLGMVQGICEFIPVSSSAHLILIKRILKIQNSSLLFDIFLHFVTLTVICIVLRKTIAKMALALLKKYITHRTQSNGEEDKLSAQALVIFFSSAITAFLAFLAIKFTSSFTSTNLIKIALGFICTSIILILARFLNFRTIPMSVTRQVLILGLLQGLATLPGISRSGSTITGYLLCGYNIKEAVKYSFLLSIPITTLSFLYSLKDLESMLTKTEIGPLLTAGLTAFTAGTFTFKTFIKTTTHKKKLSLFALYLLILAGFIIAKARI